MRFGLSSIRAAGCSPDTTRFSTKVNTFGPYFGPSSELYTRTHEINYTNYILILLLLHLQSALQPLVGFGLLYDFVPQSSIFTLLSPVSHFHLL